MTIFYIAIGAIFVLGIILFVVIEIFLPTPEEQLPYIKKSYLMTLSERKLFTILSETFTPNYYVFPQIHIASIIRVRNSEKNWQAYFNKIIRKSVDFAFFDKINISPILAIELDDSSHERGDRMTRDDFVNEVFKAAQIQILHIKTSELDSPEKIKEKINQLLQTSPPASKS